MEKLWNKNYFNCDSCPDYIYRIEKLEHFLSNHKKSIFYLVNPDEWEDPLEQIYLNKTKFIMEHPLEGKIEGGFGESFKRYYGSCWSTEGENYAKWKMYSDCHDVDNYIQIKINLEKLMGELNNNNNNLNGVRKIFYGNIVYLEYDKLKEWIETKDPTRNFDSANKDIVETFFVKRKEYEFEKEFRIIFQSDSHDKESETLFCNWNNVVEEIIVTPFIDKNEFNYVKQQLQNSGVNLDFIKRSDLFDVPNIEIAI